MLVCQLLAEAGINAARRAAEAATRAEYPDHGIDEASPNCSQCMSPIGLGIAMRCMRIERPRAVTEARSIRIGNRANGARNPFGFGLLRNRRSPACLLRSGSIPPALFEVPYEVSCAKGAKIDPAVTDSPGDVTSDAARADFLCCRVLVSSNTRDGWAAPIIWLNTHPRSPV